MRTLVLVLATGWALTGLVLPAAAHGVLQSSSPAHGTAVDSPPREVVLTFTEPVRPEASSAEVRDEAGRLVSKDFEVSPEGRTLRVAVRKLARGTYTVRWKVLSRVDGHVTSGLVTFGIGVAPPPRAQNQASPWWLVAVRWLGYLFALTLAGTVAFVHLVLPSAGGAVQAPALRGLLVASAAGLALTAALEAVLKAAWLRPLSQGFLQTLWTLVRTPLDGPSLLLRLGAALLALRSARKPASWVATAAGASGLFGFTVTSHAWATGPAAAVSDWVHLAAASVWVGGLPALALLASRTGPREGASAAARAFSRWAGYSLAVVLVTGAYGVWLQVPGWDAMAGTGYGRWLAGKLLLVGVLVALGAVNRYRLLPRLGSVKAAARRFSTAVKAEAVVAVAVLLAAGGLSITPPARTVLTAAASAPLALAGVADGWRVMLTVDPARPGWNRFELVVRGQHGAPVQVDRALLRLRKLDEQAEASTVILEPRSGGTYAAEGTYLGSAGFWELEVVLRRRGEPDRVVWFPLRVGSAGLRSELEAFRLLRRAQEAVESLRTWRETEQITDGAGNVVVTRYTYQRPDRLAFEVSGGMQGVLVGKERFVRTDRGWQRDILPEPFQARGPALYMQNPLRASLGRQDPCPEEVCRVVLWDSPDGLASFAAWVGTRTFRVYKLLMWAPAHAMTTALEDFNASLRVDRPATR